MKVNRLTPFGSIVQKALIDKNFTQEQLAKRIGTTPQYLSQIFYGVRSGEKYIPQIIKVLELDCSKIDKTVA